ncbi:MAG: hypothetical protein J6Z22_05285 [Lachnospiraceae bacterium]|nr:hypothetical protein [Lachnospiraceae bacterium]
MAQHLNDSRESLPGNGISDQEPASVHLQDEITRPAWSRVACMVWRRNGKFNELRSGWKLSFGRDQRGGFTWIRDEVSDLSLPVKELALGDTVDPAPFGFRKTA